MTRDVVSVYRASVIPERYRACAEPDPVGEDRLLTADGLVDASDGAVEAWGGYRPTWRADVVARAKADQAVEYVSWDWQDGLTEPERWTLRKLIVPCGKRMGWVKGSGRSKPLPPVLREAWKRWRSAVLRSDPAVWFAFWHVVGHGTPLPLVATENGLSNGALAAKMREFVRLFAVCKRNAMEFQRLSARTAP